jgi:peptide/nickel transport system substrate-binding protein
LSKYPHLRAAAVTTFAYYYIMFNLHNGPRALTPFGQDARLREAFELALDRTVINQVVFSGLNVETNQWLAPGDPFYVRSLPIPKRDIGRARELLAASRTLHPVVELMVLNMPELLRVGEVIQSMTKDVGIEVRLRATESAAAYQSSRKGDFEAFLTGFFAGADPDTAIYRNLTCDGSFNDGHYCDPVVEQALENGRSHVIREDRVRYYEEATSTIMRDRPNIYLLSRRFFYGHTNRLSGFEPGPTGYFSFQGMRLN